MTRDTGGGYGPLIQTHPREWVWVVPEIMHRGGIIQAARGIYDDDRGRGRRGDGLIPVPDAPGSEVSPESAPSIEERINEDPTSSKERREDLRRFEHDLIKRAIDMK